MRRCKIASPVTCRPDPRVSSPSTCYPESRRRAPVSRTVRERLHCFVQVRNTGAWRIQRRLVLVINGGETIVGSGWLLAAISVWEEPGQHLSDLVSDDTSYTNRPEPHQHSSLLCTTFKWYKGDESCSGPIHVSVASNTIHFISHMRACGKKSATVSTPRFHSRFESKNAQIAPSAHVCFNFFNGGAST